MTLPEWLEKNDLSFYAAEPLLGVTRAQVGSLASGKHRPYLGTVDLIEARTRALRKMGRTKGVVGRLDWPRSTTEASEMEALKGLDVAAPPVA